MNTVPRREVLEHFLGIESTRPVYAPRKPEFEAWTKLDDDAFLSRIKAFSQERDDFNPLLTWTVGTQKTLFHNYHRRVSCWHDEIVSLDRIYTSGVNLSMKQDLSRVAWNLHAFAGLYAHKYEEFQLGKSPGPLLARVVVVRHRRFRKKGDYEIIDGAHRVVAMIQQGARKTPAYVARLKRPWM